MKGMIFVDFSLLLASISLAVSIISPIVMKFVEGRHQERMKKIDIFTNEQEIRSKYIDEYLRSAGSALVTIHPSSSYHPDEKQKIKETFLALSVSVIRYLDMACQSCVEDLVSAVESESYADAFDKFSTLSCRLAELEAERTRELAQILHRPGILQSLHYQITNRIKRFRSRQQRKAR